MVALYGPNSITAAPVGAIKRPSDVPPAVESVAAAPLIAAIALCAAWVNSDGWVIKGCPEMRQSSV